MTGWHPAGSFKAEVALAAEIAFANQPDMRLAVDLAQVDDAWPQAGKLSRLSLDLAMTTMQSGGWCGPSN